MNPIKFRRAVLLILSILSLLIAFLWWWENRVYEPLLAFIAGVAGIVDLLFINAEQSEKETLAQRNRRILLGHVENFWIRGVLEKSLYGVALLELGMKEDPDAVKYPWAIKQESTDETIPAGTSMLEIFENVDMGRSLLILGAPGSGKTTMLLELARLLIERARQNETEPIPIVFNLASWMEKQFFTDWLTQELINIYNIPRRTAPDWINGNRLFLLLDSLDEVQLEKRTKCLNAINHFIKEHGLTSVVVCSRSQDYDDLKVKLRLNGAIEIQPLSQDQVEEYIDRFGNKLSDLRLALMRDPMLRKTVETPLFLSIIIMTYNAQNNSRILKNEDNLLQRNDFFDIYIDGMFERARFRNKTFDKKKQRSGFHGSHKH